MHRATPHSTTGVAPATLLYERPIQIMLPSTKSQNNEVNHEIMSRDESRKQKMKDYSGNLRNAKPKDICVNDYVIVKQIRP